MKEIIRIDIIVLVSIMDLKDITWNKQIYDEFINYLKSIGEEEYRKFSEKITFTKYEMLGIRLPKLRSIAKEISKGDYKSYLKVCKSNYYEEVMIRLLVIASIKDLNECMLYFDDAINLIDNWARMIVEQNAAVIGYDVAQDAVNSINADKAARQQAKQAEKEKQEKTVKRTRQTKKEGGTEENGEEKTKRRRTTKTA